jgi:cyclopropane fatty-acyl-phospholipid synthase-like methyltransferase
MQQQFDWAKEWGTRRESDFFLSRLRKKGVTLQRYYNTRPAELMELHYSYVNYPGPIFDKMRSLIAPEFTVLDIGAGDGAFTIEFAKTARKVTAVEPSPGQVGRLKEKARREGLNNIEIINKRWEDTEESELELYDVVNAAYCFSMPDIKGALRKMLNQTKKLLFLVTSADNGFTDTYRKVFKTGHIFMDEYIYLCNILYQLGVQANVSIITRVFDHPWNLMLELLRLELELTSAQERELFEELQRKGQIIEKDGDIWVKSWHKDALIWFKKNELE